MSKELSIERMKSCALKNKNRNNKKINLTVVAHVGLTFSNRFVLKRETKKKMKLWEMLKKITFRIEVSGRYYIVSPLTQKIRLLAASLFS